MKTNTYTYIKSNPVHDRIVSSLELGDGAGTPITNLWSASPSELSFTTNGFGGYTSGYYAAHLRSGYNNSYARSVDSNGGFANTAYTTNTHLSLRPAVHITEPKIRFVIKPQHMVICQTEDHKILWKSHKSEPN